MNTKASETMAHLVNLIAQQGGTVAKLAEVSYDVAGGDYYGFVTVTRDDLVLLVSVFQTNDGPLGAVSGISTLDDGDTFRDDADLVPGSTEPLPAVAAAYALVTIADFCGVL